MKRRIELKKANQKLKKESIEMSVDEKVVKNLEPAENQVLKPAEQKKQDEVATLEPDVNFNSQVEIKKEKTEETVGKKLEEQSKADEPNEDDETFIGPFIHSFIYSHNVQQSFRLIKAQDNTLQLIRD